MKRTYGPSAEKRAANRRAKARVGSSNPVLRDSWERYGVLACGQCCRAVSAPGVYGVIAATYPDDILEAVVCRTADCYFEQVPAKESK